MMVETPGGKDRRGWCRNFYDQIRGIERLLSSQLGFRAGSKSCVVRPNMYWRVVAGNRFVKFDEELA